MALDMAAARAHRRPYHHGNLRAALLEAALVLVQREGVEALTLRGVARRAGVSPAAPYRHFADKRALLAAVAEEGFRLLATALREAGGAEDPRERFRARGRAYVGFATAHPSHFRVMFGRELADRTGYPGLRDAGAAAFDALVEGMLEAQRAGVVREGDPRELGLAAWSAMHGLSSLLLTGRLQAMFGAGADELAALVGRTLHRGLAPRSGA
jgi:AcrR family transcriptional regulator